MRSVVSWTAGAAVAVTVVSGELIRFVNASKIEEEFGDSSGVTEEISGWAASAAMVELGKIVISAQLKNCSGFKNPLDPSRGSG
jgi:hypothetical protein